MDAAAGPPPWRDADGREREIESVDLYRLEDIDAEEIVVSWLPLVALEVLEPFSAPRAHLPRGGCGWRRSGATWWPGIWICSRAPATKRQPEGPPGSAPQAEDRASFFLHEFQSIERLPLQSTRLGERLESGRSPG